MITAIEKLPDDATVRPEPVTAERKRRANRPTTPDLESLYFQAAIHLTRRETALFMHCLGRTTDGGKALVEMFLNPPADGV